MKINQSPVNTQPKTSVQENTSKAGLLTDEKTEKIQNIEEGGVTLTVSQRNIVGASDDSTAEEPVGGIKALLEKLMANPENTATVHSGLSPDKVLQLLA